MNKTSLNTTQPCIPSLTTSWLGSEMMPAQRLSVIVPFYVVFLQLMQQMIVTGPLRLDDASTLYCRPRSDLSWLLPPCFSCISPCFSCFPPFLFLYLPHVYIKALEPHLIDRVLIPDLSADIYGRGLQLNNLLIFSKSRVEEMEMRRFCI